MNQPTSSPETFGLDVAEEALRIHRRFGVDGLSYIAEWSRSCREDDAMLELLKAIKAEVVRLAYRA